MIDNKKLMYEMMQKQLLGNCFRIFETEEELLKSGVKTATIRGVGRPNLPCIPWVPASEIFSVARDYERRNSCKAIVQECDDGLKRLIQGELQLQNEPTFFYSYSQAYMRGALKDPHLTGHATNLEVYSLLKTYLNSASFEDVTELLNNFPGHVIELTVYEKCLGWAKGRNYVIWEIRNY